MHDTIVNPQPTSVVAPTSGHLREETEYFLKAMVGKNDISNEVFDFRVFDDSDVRAKAYRKKYPKRKGGDPDYTRKLRGTLDQRWNELVEFNRRGCGIFVTINRTDGKGVETENIVEVIALFVDLDGASLDGPLNFKYSPSHVVESSVGKWHSYWWAYDFARDKFETHKWFSEEFTAAQERLIAEFNSDKKVKDLPRVMRLPGFYHLKDGAEPFLTINVKEYCRVEPRKIHPAEAFGVRYKKPDEPEIGGGGVISMPSQGKDPNDIDGLALLPENMPKWVTPLFKGKARKTKLGYEIWPEDVGGWRDADGNLLRDEKTGEPLEERIHITAKGITHHGTGDQSYDERRGARHASDLVMQFGGAPDRYTAHCWLCRSMGLPEPADWRSDFVAYMVEHKYVFLPTRDMWPAASVNARIKPTMLVDKQGQPLLDDKGKERLIPANVWFDKHRPVEQITWAPGENLLIPGRLIADGGWIARDGCTVLNLYRPPTLKHGDKNDAKKWLDHVRKVYPDDADHIVRWLAHRVQRPQDKINHALVLGGRQGIGKDTLLEPVKRAVGSWNVQEVSPKQVMGRFNGFLKSVILCINEVRDLGDFDRFSFYSHMKAITTSPPKVHYIDEKNLREYKIPNLCGVIMTLNDKTNGIYLAADDRRHYVAWSELDKDGFAADYWNDIWRWYDSGGGANVAAYLAALDLSGFDPKAPPPKTAAFWAIADANRAPEDAELADALDRLGNPNAVTLEAVQCAAEGDFREWLKDRKYRRQLPHRFEQCGYVVVRNEANKRDGQWTIRGRRQTVYAKEELSNRDRIEAVKAVISDPREPPF